MTKDKVTITVEEFRALPYADRNEVLQDLRDQREQLRELIQLHPVDPESPTVYFTYN